MERKLICLYIELELLLSITVYVIPIQSYRIHISITAVVNVICYNVFARM